jgi:hypothetical protein
MIKTFHTVQLNKVSKFAILLLLSFNVSLAQNSQKTKYYNADQFYLYGKAFDNTPNRYHRVDTALYNDLSPTIKRLLSNSAGLAIVFKTNSTTVSAKWTVGGNKPLSNMTPIAQKGLDLYIKKNGKWEFAGVGKPNGNTGNGTIVESMDSSDKECMLFLPLYDELKQLEIGVDENSTISSLENPFRKKIVIYGSSIVHGASAGRPGMAYPAQLSRTTGLYFINLGMSGNAKMEPEAAKMVSDITQVDAFILDCIPNPSPVQIKERTENFIKTIRQKHPKTPIILVQTIIRELGNFNLHWRTQVQDQNDEATAAFNRLKNAGIKDIYLIKGEHLIGDDHEGTTDGTHPNDLGFYRMTEQLSPQIMKILSPYGIK